MKFGRRLREQTLDVFDEEILAHTIDYKGLKKRIGIIRRRRTAGQDVTAEVAEWVEVFRAEVRKFDPFFQARFEEARGMVDGAEGLLGDSSAAARARMQELYCVLHELRLFAALNRTGCRKILKKMDKNIPGVGIQEAHKDILDGLAVARLESEVMNFALRIVCVYAANFHQGRSRLAQMELDLHVTCVSDILAHTLVETAAGGTSEAEASEDASAGAAAAMGPLGGGRGGGGGRGIVVAASFDSEPPPLED